MQGVIWKNSNIADIFTELGSVIPSGFFLHFWLEIKVFIDKHFPSFQALVPLKVHFLQG